MEYRNLGRSGLKVSVVGLGTNQLGGKVDAAGADRILHKALDLGVNFIDTADIYTGGQSETLIGPSIKQRRHEVILATKVGMKAGEGPHDVGASRQHIMDGVEASLRRLDTDHIDLYQIHRWDPDTPAEETMRALDDLVSSGKVRYIGASNYPSWQICHANAVAERYGWARFESVQPHYHMLEREVEKELTPFCQAFGLGVIPYFPLAGGFLTGKYRRGQTLDPEARRSRYVQRYFNEQNLDIIEQLETFAQERGHTLGELAVAWLLAQPTVSTVICGATGPEQVEKNVKGGEWVLSADEEKQVRGILEPEA